MLYPKWRIQLSHIVHHHFHSSPSHFPLPPKTYITLTPHHIIYRPTNACVREPTSPGLDWRVPHGPIRECVYSPGRPPPDPRHPAEPRPRCMALAARSLVPAHDRNLPLADDKSPLRGPIAWIGRPRLKVSKRTPRSIPFYTPSWFYLRAPRPAPPAALSAHPCRLSAFVLSAFEDAHEKRRRSATQRRRVETPRLGMDTRPTKEKLGFGAHLN